MPTQESKKSARYMFRNECLEYEHNTEELYLKNEIAQVFLTVSGNSIFQDVLRILLDFFESPYGILGYISREGEYVCPSLTKTIWDQCALIQKDKDKEAIVFHPNLWGGLWGRGLQEGRTLVSSGPFQLPQGHVQLQEVIVVPILYKRDVIGQIVLGDKEGGYDQWDQALLERIADYMAPILNARLERAWAKEDLEQAKARAEEANKAKSEFLANMSHELRTPLHGILGCLQLLENEDAEEERRELIQIASKSGQNLLQLLNDILEFSSIEFVQGHVDAVEFDISEEIATVTQIFTQQLQSKNLILAQEIGDDIPKKVYGDVARFRQIMLNLVGNAIKFSSQGTISIMAHVLRRTDSDSEPNHPYLLPDPHKVHILFTVADSGIGVQDKQMDMIFEAFAQGNGTLSKEYPGAGLGLSVVKRNIELMQGTMAVDNSGPGTSFYFTLKFELPT